ncbi:MULTISPECIES: alpha/beta hydrolase [Streptosporangium]|uniref:Pimeloyl-ACP methyl ester carboxylesterase n=1 Tax=Streptosporangium brasiliense TaxID=47480 RepID=A0ABT9RFW0_9ACTN|nr:alpha/beta hydrolase [Streptosporangium brasiliense]MDP9868171.1 pimeloyl-ACP methyl ester carboxylesterase [Streptosporangium brasiliense]
MPSTFDLARIRQANATGRVPVVFIHGLWLLPTSWERWARVFDEAGFAPITPDWPVMPPAGATAGEVADHFADLIGGLERRPAVVGHSTGGLLTQVLAGRGMACAGVAIGPAPFRGALPLPISPPRVPARASADPAAGRGAVPLTYDQFRHSFANAVGEEEAEWLYETFAVPAPGAPPLQASAAAFDPWSGPEVDSTAEDRGPLLLISGEMDATVPWTVVHASYRNQVRNAHHLTEIIEMPGRGHSLTVDSGWREVCGTALTFIQRFVDP